MWIELHDGAREHPKLVKLARDLSITRVQALGHLASLWLWTLRMAPDGNLSSFDEEDVEIGAQWEGEPGKFFAAAKARKLLVETDGENVVNDWAVYSGSLKSGERKREERERKRIEREAKKNADIQSLSENVRGQTRTNPIATNLSGGVTQNERPERPERPEQNDRNEQQPLSSSQKREPDGVVVSASDPETEHHEPQRAPEIREVFAHYRTYHARSHPRPQSNGKEWKLISARLKEGYSVEDLRQAITGIHLSPFHNGENDRGAKYQDLKLAMRDSDQVAKLIAIVEQHANGPPPVMSEKEQRGARAGYQWLERHRQREVDNAGP